ncbi:MAG: heme-binding protein [Thermodesulfobacteriota bacterium]
MYQKNVLTLKTAMKGMEAMLQEAAKDPSTPFAIAIVDNCGELICFARQDGCQQFRNEMAIKKAYTAAQFRRSTRKQVEEGFKPEGLDLTMFGLGDRYTTIAGGVPILKPGEEGKKVGQWRDACGAIGTSGARQDGDERIAMLGLKFIQDILWPKE